MSIMALANSLMLDFRCVIVPRFVYATGRDFAGDCITGPQIAERTAGLAATLARLAGRLAEINRPRRPAIAPWQ